MYHRSAADKNVLPRPPALTPPSFLQTAIHENENGEKMCECKVTIISDDDADNIADSFLKAMSDTAAKYKLGTSGYAQQFSGIKMFESCCEHRIKASQPPPLF